MYRIRDIVRIIDSDKISESYRNKTAIITAIRTETSFSIDVIRNDDSIERGQRANIDQLTLELDPERIILAAQLISTNPEVINYGIPHR